MRFLIRSGFWAALCVGRAEAADDTFRYRRTDVEIGGALMLAEVEYGYGRFAPGKLAWEASPFLGIAPLFGWSIFGLETAVFTAPALGYPAVGSDLEGRVPAYAVAAIHPVVALGPVSIGPYAALGLGDRFLAYWGVGAKAGVSFGDCGTARAWGASIRWTVREQSADTSHDFALAIRYRFEPADLRAAHACP